MNPRQNRLLAILPEKTYNMSEPLKKISTILLIENDDETRRLLIANLRDRNYRLLPAPDEETAVEWILSHKAINIDLILINQVEISQQECVAKIQRIYRQTGLSLAIPSVIIADRYQAELEGTEQKINDNKYIIYLENAQQLFNLIHRLCFN